MGKMIMSKQNKKVLQKQLEQFQNAWEYADSHGKLKIIKLKSGNVIYTTDYRIVEWHSKHENEIYVQFGSLIGDMLDIHANVKLSYIKEVW